MLVRRLLQQTHLIVFVHRDDVIKSLKIILSHSPRMNFRERNAAPFSGGIRPSIWRFADVIRMGASRIDKNPVCQATLIDVVPEYTFRCR
jgi:hypothetical protein